MKTLKESLLDKTKNKVSNTATKIHKLNYFGGQFKFMPNEGLFRERDMSLVNIRTLNKLTAGMDWVSKDTEDEMKKGFIYHTPKVEKLIKWFDNLDLEELGVGIVDVNDNNSLGKLSNVIKNKMFDDNLFNKPKIVEVMIFRGSIENNFTISISKKNTFDSVYLHFTKRD